MNNNVWLIDIPMSDTIVFTRCTVVYGGWGDGVASTPFMSLIPCERGFVHGWNLQVQPTLLIVSNTKSKVFALVIQHSHCSSIVKVFVWPTHTIYRLSRF